MAPPLHPVAPPPRPGAPPPRPEAPPSRPGAPTPPAGAPHARPGDAPPSPWAARLLLVLPWLCPWLCAGLTGCLGLPSRPELQREPWAAFQPGTVGIGIRPGLFTLYGIDGEFESQNLVTGDPVNLADSGDLVGRFGLALRGELFLSEEVQVSLGLDYRLYDIENLTPIQGLDVLLDTAQSNQVYVGYRYNFPPFEPHPRTRPFLQATISYLPGFDIDGIVDLSSFGSSSLPVSTSTDGSWVWGAATGMVHQWSDSTFLEWGVLYERPLTDLDAVISFNHPSLALPDIQSELRPTGFIGFVGLSTYF